MHLVDNEDQKEWHRFRLFRVKQSFILFERTKGTALPVRMRIFNRRANQELNTGDEVRIKNQLRTIGQLYSKIKAGKKADNLLTFVGDYNDPTKTTNLIKGERRSNADQFQDPNIRC